MHLYIRADADSRMGTGHIMRCIALAQAWQDQGGEVTFISHCDSEPLKERIKDEGFTLIPIERISPDPSDLENTLSILKTDISGKKKWIVLDGYHFIPAYQKAIRDEGISLTVIDDMNHLDHYHADVLLNQNINAPELTYHCDDDTALLLGTRYALLRREFLQYRDYRHNVPERARNILVTLGGADQDNVTLKVIDALKLFEDLKIQVKIVIGPANPYQEILSQALSSAQFACDLITNPTNIPELMAWANLAISAGGSTCWELIFMGVPSILITIAENQQQVAEHLALMGLASNLGWYNSLAVHQLSCQTQRLVYDFQKRKFMSQLGHSLIDGDGVVRVIDSMRKHCVQIPRN